MSLVCSGNSETVALRTIDIPCWSHQTGLQYSTYAGLHIPRCTLVPMNFSGWYEFVYYMAIHTMLMFQPICKYPCYCTVLLISLKNQLGYQKGVDVYIYRNQVVQPVASDKCLHSLFK